MENLNVLYPEIFLFLSSCVLLLLGVYKKNSFDIIYKLTVFILLFTIFLIINYDKEATFLFLDVFINDRFSNFIKILILLSSVFVLISSYEFIKKNKISNFEYPIIILLSIIGMFFMVSSNDLILFYLGLELQSLSLYILAAIDRNNLRSSEAGIKYFVLSALSSGLLLYGCSLLYGFTGSTNFEIIQSELSNNYGGIFSMVFILVGLSFKISAVPFHMWTPDVYEGSPSSITNFFAIVPKLAGVAVLIRFMDIPFKNILIEWQSIIIFISIASMVLGSVAAIGQTNIKRLMAYSSIGHIGFAIAGIATGTQEGFSSTIFYMTIYIVMNTGVFCCIYFMQKDGNYMENIQDLSGLSKNQPLLALAFLILFFSMAGIPPLGGFFAKFYVFMTVIKNEMYALAIIGLLTTVISAFYYLKVIKVIYFDNSILKFDKNNNFAIRATLLMSCIFLVVFFIKPSLLINIVNSLF
tara:strand:- start:397 stop:1800 length:1404 start_codon:yes stop_codon:yes gene_type:complete